MSGTFCLHSRSDNCAGESQAWIKLPSVIADGLNKWVEKVKQCGNSSDARKALNHAAAIVALAAPDEGGKPSKTALAQRANIDADFVSKFFFSGRSRRFLCLLRIVLCLSRKSQ